MRKLFASLVVLGLTLCASSPSDAGYSSGPYLPCDQVCCGPFTQGSDVCTVLGGSITCNIWWYSGIYGGACP